MNSKSFLIIIMVITVSLSSLVGGTMKRNKVEAVSRPIDDYEVSQKPSEPYTTIENSLNEGPDLTLKEQEGLEEVFKYEPLTDEIKNKIVDISWNEKASYPIDDLAYITVTYYGFNGEIHIGELIMHKKVAPEIIEIFQELYDKKFPIEKVRLIDEYDAIDQASMADNNSSALCVRPITNKPYELSKHSYGLAIDLNPIQNPYISPDGIFPDGGNEFLDRTHVRKGMIVEGDACYEAFTSRGWTWGGNWTSIKDYQHFEKDIEIEVTGKIPEVSKEGVSKHLLNALELTRKIMNPESEKIIERNGHNYGRYPEALNSKEKILSSLRVFYTPEFAEEIYESSEKIIIEDALYSLLNSEVYPGFSKKSSIKLVEESEDSHTRTYIMETQDKEGELVFEIKYIGSQGWRITFLENIDTQ